MRISVLLWRAIHRHWKINIPFQAEGSLYKITPFGLFWFLKRGKKMYKYDLHVHTNVGSLCGVSTPEEMVNSYYRAGYSGFVITDHFIRGNTAVSAKLPWAERIDAYYGAVLRARREAEKYPGFTVFLGGEFCYAGGHEILIYGADTEFLKAHSEIENCGAESLCSLMRENDCVTVKAHPYRVRDYNDITVSPELYCVDGYEVFNSHNTAEENAKAMAFAEKNSLIMTSGGDIHNFADENVGKAGIETERQLNTNADLAALLKSGDYRLIADF